jgi:predicted amidohydrolase
MRAAAIQFPVSMDVQANVAALEAAVAGIEPGTLVVAPEGSLSGYEPVPGFVAKLDSEQTNGAIASARELAASAKIHLVVGACIQVQGVWKNSTFYLGPSRELWRYDKINLAQSERGTFEAGDALPILNIVVDREPVCLAVQMCREIRYPEQWRYLSECGAQVIAYVNNAIGSTNGHALWRAHVISRAAENQRFIVGANNSARDQTCPSMIVSPAGLVVAEAAIGSSQTIKAEIDLSEVSNWVIDQARSDVVALTGGINRQCCCGARATDRD